MMVGKIQKRGQFRNVPHFVTITLFFLDENILFDPQKFLFFSKKIWVILISCDCLSHVFGGVVGADRAEGPSLT